jgi:hypothetical protein
MFVMNIGPHYVKLNVSNVDEKKKFLGGGGGDFQWAGN